MHFDLKTSNVLTAFKRPAVSASVNAQLDFQARKTSNMLPQNFISSAKDGVHVHSQAPGEALILFANL